MSTLANSFQTRSNSTAIIVPTEPPLTVTYAHLNNEVLSFQHKLAALGITHGSAVSIALANSYEFIVSFLAASWQRGIAAPLNPAYKQSEFEFYIGDLSSSLALVPRDAYAQDAAAVRAARKYKAAIAECYWDPHHRTVVLDVKEKGKLANAESTTLKRPKPDDIALVLHTSGTTGRPKAVPLTHRNLTRTMANITATYGLTPADRTLLVMPLFHVHGLLAAFLAPLAAHGSVIVPPRFSASDFWPTFRRHRATWYTAVPTIHQILLKQPPPPEPRPAIRFVRSCSSPLSPTVHAKLEQVFRAPVLEAYAMTEAAHQMTSNPLPPGRRIAGSVGVGQGVEVKILDQRGEEIQVGKEGEICIRGENVTGGYLNNEKANKESFANGGFFRTGDQGKMDEGGYLYITGRIKEFVNKGGEKISPIEIDNVVSQHPAVGEAVSFAIDDDEIYGQDVGLAVALKDGRKLTSDELRGWLTERIAKFKLPKKIFFVDAMPKTATGKVQRRQVAAAMLEKEKTKAKL